MSVTFCRHSHGKEPLSEQQGHVHIHVRLNSSGLIWICMNVRQSRKFGIKASKEHQKQRRHWKDCWPQNVSTAPKGRLKCLKDLRSEREAIWTSICNGASDRSSCHTLTSAGWVDEAILMLRQTELDNRGREIRNIEESVCIFGF